HPPSADLGTLVVEAQEPTASANVRVVVAGGALEGLYLYVRGFRSQLLRGAALAREAVGGVYQTHRDGAGATHPAAGAHVQPHRHAYGWVRRVDGEQRLAPEVVLEVSQTTCPLHAAGGVNLERPVHAGEHG